MGVRSYLSNTLINWGIILGRKAGCEERIQLSEHSITIDMVNPDRDDLAWDSSMYKYGNVFHAGYANAIKPTVDYNEELEEPDTVNVEESEETDSDNADGPHVELISSPRYRDYMRQDLISQLLNPREQWKIIAYAIIGLAMLMCINVVVSLSAAGVL